MIDFFFWTKVTKQSHQNPPSPLQKTKWKEKNNLKQHCTTRHNLKNRNLMVMWLRESHVSLSGFHESIDLWTPKWEKNLSYPSCPSSKETNWSTRGTNICTANTVYHWACSHENESRSERHFGTWFGPFLIWKPDFSPCKRKAVSNQAFETRKKGRFGSWFA